MQLHDLLGNLGVAIIVGSYLMLQLGRMAVDGLAYSLLNAIGAGLILFSLLHAFNLSAFMVEVFWLLISCYGLVRWRQRAKE